ncbi:MAG: type sorting protein, partial [Mucilaginibacter sp.]|nr:type sorting protein [Mucilaginibacter sp.]
MYASEKYIRVLLSKPLKLFCVLLILLISAFSFAYNHQAAITPMVKVIQPKTELPPHNPLVSGLIKKHTAALSLPANTPPDITVNLCGATSTTLTAPSIPSGYTNPTWNDGTTGSTLNVTSSGNYWWQVIGTSVVNNGNFSQGDTGFTSSYTDVTTISPNGSQLYPEAAYAIGTNPNAYHNGFYSYGDHTSGSGNMLVVNGASGAAAANVPVWSENIPVAANTNYVFSVWVRSASLQSPAILQFSINGTPLGGTITPTSPASTSAWQYFTATWSSGPSPSATNTISLVNQNIAASGNDFAIDDIVFAPVYRQNYIVNLNPIPVLSVISEICGVPSYDLTQTIIGYDLSTYTYTYKDGSGNILSGTQITSAPIGTYTITETNKATGCTSNPQNTTVSINPVPPLSVTSPPAQCAPYDLKNAINGYDATTYTYTYQNGATTLGSSVVSTSGTYTITATNKVTGCVSNPQNVTVTINLLTNLTVTNPSVTCVANAPASSLTYDLYNAITSSKTGYTYIYEDMAGNVLGTGTNFTVTENATNTYQIIEQNAAGCQSAPKTVTITFDNPFLSVISSVTVCGAAPYTYDLQNAITNYDPGTYTYTYRNGANTSTISQTVNNNGTYTIRAANKSTNCRTIATVQVNFVTPATLAVTSPPAQCGGTYDLKSAITGYDATTYAYTYKNGATTLGSSVVSASGTYTITETNISTG